MKNLLHGDIDNWEAQYKTAVDDFITAAQLADACDDICTDEGMEILASVDEADRLRTEALEALDRIASTCAAMADAIHDFIGEVIEAGEDATATAWKAWELAAGRCNEANEAIAAVSAYRSDEWYPLWDKWE